VTRPIHAQVGSKPAPSVFEFAKALARLMAAEDVAVAPEVGPARMPPHRKNAA